MKLWPENPGEGWPGVGEVQSEWLGPAPHLSTTSNPLALAAGSAVSSAIKHEEGDKGIELIDVASYVDLAGDYLMARGAFPEQWEVVESALSAETAATRAHAFLRRAAQQFPADSLRRDDDFEALVEVWGAIRGLRGCL